MQGRVIVRIDACIVGEHVIHLVEAVRCRHVLWLVTEMPLSELYGGVASLLQGFGDRRSFGREAVGVARREDRRQRGANRDTTRDERSPPSGTARLSVVIDET